MRIVIVVAALIALKSVDACQYEGQPYEHGDEWIVKEVFVMNCTHNTERKTWKTQIIGCRTKSGIRVGIGQNQSDGISLWLCVNESGIVKLKEGRNPGAKCDGTYENGDIWAEGAFEYTCRDGGLKQVTACMVDGNKRIALNQIIEENGFSTECKHYPNGTVTLARRQLVPAEPECVEQDGSRHKYGTYWIQDSHFNKTCLSDGRIIVASCITRDRRTRIPVNGEKVAGNIRYICERRADNSVHFRQVN